MEAPLNYRHAFHAGNFADLVKHALLLAILDQLQGEGAPVEVIDTHAGAGLYDLEGEAAQKSGEAAAGVVRLLDAADPPGVFAPLAAAVRAANPATPATLYPGSPALVLQRLRSGDAYDGCELRADDFDTLRRLILTSRLPPGARAQARLSDGYAFAATLPPSGERGRRLILIDPPFERGDEYARIVQTVGRTLAADGRVVHAIWTPLKDLETFDALLRELEKLRLPPAFAAQVRLRPLHDPMRMNGCAVIVIGCPAVEATARAACAWVAAALGERGGSGRVERLGA